MSATMSHLSNPFENKILNKLRLSFCFSWTFHLLAQLGTIDLYRQR